MAMNPKRILSVLLLLAPALLAQEAVLSDDMRQAAGTISEKRLRADLGFIASDEMRGRDTPSPELDRAADWLAARFKSLGLEPAFGKSWFQGRHEGLRSKSKGTLTAGGRTWPLGPDHIRVPGPGTDGADTLALVALPLPRRRSEVPVDEVRGKAVVLTRLDNGAELSERQRHLYVRSAARWLGSAGARAVLLPPGLHVSERRFRGSPIPLIWLDDKKASLAAASDEKASLSLQVPVTPLPLARNVGGLIRGSDPKLAKEVIAFSAHYDHIGVRGTGKDTINNGADDDGTGTVSVVAIAGAMKRLARAPRRTTLFLLFYGEEKGLLGSRYYCEHPALPLARTRAVFNIEMVGRPDDIEPRTAWVTGWKQSDFGKLIQPAGAAIDIRFYENLRGRLSARLFGASDNFPFARRGVPAHSISAGSLHADYHRPSDEVEKIDFANMTRVVQGIFAAGAVMADGGAVPTWKAGTRYAEAHKKLLDSSTGSGR